MQTIKLYNGHSMPTLGFGLWNVPGASIDSVVDTSLGAGYRLFDSAYLYHNETEVGKALKKAMPKYNLKREDIFITSKVWITQKRPENVRKACKKTLSELQTNYLDLYLIHFPITCPPNETDLPFDSTGNALQYEKIPIMDTWKAMEALVKDGLVKSIGVSNFNRAQIEELLNGKPEIKPANLQVEVHANFPNLKLTDYAESKGIKVTGYSPLGTPEFSATTHKMKNLVNEPWIGEIAKRYHKTPAQVLLRYIVQRGFAVIPKSVRTDRIVENAGIFDFKLTSEDMTSLNTKGTQERSVYFPGMQNHPEYPFKAEY